MAEFHCPAIHLTRSSGGTTSVAVDVGGRWVNVITEHDDIISHIVEPLGIRKRVEQALGSAGAQAPRNEWAEVERLRDLPDVDEALLNFKDDCTGDNAAMLVRAVRRAVLGNRPGYKLVPIEPPDALAEHLTAYSLDPRHGMSERDRTEVKNRLQRRWAAILAALDGDGVGDKS